MVVEEIRLWIFFFKGTKLSKIPKLTTAYKRLPFVIQKVGKVKWGDQKRYFRFKATFSVQPSFKINSFDWVCV